MAVRFDHTIVAARDKRASAAFLADVLGLAPPTGLGPFAVVALDDGVSLDYVDADDVRPQHYAFLVTEDEFDGILGRIRARGLPYWADPYRRRPGEVGTAGGARGVYWEDPDGHVLEALTRPYGG